MCMSLDLPQLLPQVQQLSQSLFQQQAQRAEMLDLALQAYQRLVRLLPEELENRLAHAGSRWVGARPTREGLSDSFPPPQPHQGLTVIGADGSQVYPDRHGVAFYYLLNLAGIRIQHDSQSAPETRTITRLFFEPEQLHYENDQPVESAWVNLQRDLGEMALLAEMSDDARADEHLALLDNSLLLWMLLQAHSAGGRELDRVLSAYLDAMRRLQASSTALAGIIDRPRSSNMLALAALASKNPEPSEQDETQRAPFPGLTDRDLFGRLLPESHRSACFELVSPLNREFIAAGQGIQFFYLHYPLGQILRVEVPGWVAAEQALLERVHAGLLREGRSTAGYPYALIRAHELAVVTQSERSLVEDWVSRELSSRGMPPSRSRKALSKTLTAGSGRLR
jgi:hypothetical protein